VDLFQVDKGRMICIVILGKPQGSRLPHHSSAKVRGKLQGTENEQ